MLNKISGNNFSFVAVVAIACVIKTFGWNPKDGRVSLIVLIIKTDSKFLVKTEAFNEYSNRIADRKTLINEFCVISDDF